MSSFYSASFTAHLNVMANGFVLFVNKDQLLAADILCLQLSSQKSWTSEMKLQRKIVQSFTIHQILLNRQICSDESLWFTQYNLVLDWFLIGTVLLACCFWDLIKFVIVINLLCLWSLNSLDFSFDDLVLEDFEKKYFFS